MRTKHGYLLTLAAVFAGFAFVGTGCVTEEGNESPASHAGGATDTGGTGGTTATAGSTGTAGDGAGGAEDTGGTGGDTPTGGTAGEQQFAGAGGAGPVGGTAGAAGEAPCLGDVYIAGTAPDCDTLAGANTDCGAGGAGGAGAALEPLGVDSCRLYVAEGREGFAEAFFYCVGAISDAPCSAAYDTAVYDCVDNLTLLVCDSSAASGNCGSFTCSELATDECVNMLKIYQPGDTSTGQGRIMDCYGSPGDVTGCRDMLRDCE
jgi:hypothetical protein